MTERPDVLIEGCQACPCIDYEHLVCQHPDGIEQDVRCFDEEWVVPADCPLIEGPSTIRIAMPVEIREWKGGDE